LRVRDGTKYFHKDWMLTGTLQNQRFE
jgi:hypothetical protein